MCVLRPISPVTQRSTKDVFNWEVRIWIYNYGFQISAKKHGIQKPDFAVPHELRKAKSVFGFYVSLENPKSLFSIRKHP